jgi:phenylacetate-CoA ligase
VRVITEPCSFYRRKWAEAGVDASRCSLAELPFTTKDELRRSQDAHPPLGETQGAPLTEIIRIQGTGGTTGVPMRIGMTREDVATLDAIGARVVTCAGARPGLVIAECMNYSLYVGGVTDHMGFEEAGCAVLPYGVGESERLVRLLEAMRTPWALYSTPGYALRLAQVALAAGVEPRSLGMERGFFSGEAGMGVPGFRERIEETWGCVARDIYGLAETGYLAAECDHLTGLHFETGDDIVVELIDPATGGSLDLAAGTTGELVYTTPTRRASPLVRYRSHDLAEVLGGSCPCGRDGLRVRLLGRSDDMFIVRGVNVFPLAIQDVLLALRPATTGEFRVLLDRAPPIDEDPHIQVEAEGITADAIAESLRSRLGFTARVEVLAPETLPRPATKTRRVYRLHEGDRP